MRKWLLAFGILCVAGTAWAGDFGGRIRQIVSVIEGGTGASTAAGARTNLGLVPGTDVASLSGGKAVTSELGTGTPSSSTYLRGDGAWSTVPSGYQAIRYQKDTFSWGFRGSSSGYQDGGGTNNTVGSATNTVVAESADGRLWAKWTAGGTAGNSTALSYTGSANVRADSGSPWAAYWTFRTGSTISNLRLFLCFSNATTPTNSDTSPNNSVCVRYTNGTDTTFVLVARDASAQSSATFGPSVAINTTYVAKVYWNGTNLVGSAATDSGVTFANASTAVTGNIPTAQNLTGRLDAITIATTTASPVLFGDVTVVFNP